MKESLFFLMGLGRGCRAGGLMVWFNQGLLTCCSLRIIDPHVTPASINKHNSFIVLEEPGIKFQQYGAVKQKRNIFIFFCSKDSRAPQFKTYCPFLFCWACFIHVARSSHHLEPERQRFIFILLKQVCLLIPPKVFLIVFLIETILIKLCTIFCFSVQKLMRQLMHCIILAFLYQFFPKMFFSHGLLLLVSVDNQAQNCPFIPQTRQRGRQGCQLPLFLMR